MANSFLKGDKTVSEITKISKMPRWLKWLRGLPTVFITTGLFYASYVYAVPGAGGAPTIGEAAMKITESFAGIAKLITAGAYIGGMGFALSAILKFKQHKDNPTQIPIGTPIALLFIAAALIFLPTIFGAANATIFGGSGSAGGISGVTE